jgi:hypothetical protein
MRSPNNWVAKLDIRCLTAPRTGPGELKQRLLHLLMGELVQVQALAIGVGQLQEEVPVFPLLLAKGQLRLHIDGFLAGFGFVLGRTHLHTQSTTCTVFGRHLNRELQIRPGFVLGPCVLEGDRSVLQLPRFVHLGANDRVGHTITHLPHCTHTSGSQVGISWATLRFSYFVVPVG